MSTSEAANAQPEWRIPDALRRQLLALLCVPPEQASTMTFEQFLDWADEDTLAEWVDGRVVMASPASARHQRLARFLQRLLSTYTEIKTLGEVFVPPFQMKLSRSSREPDLLFVASERLERVRAIFLDGPADLVVEIISPESRGRDRGDKFYEYQEARIPEYWLLDPETQQAEFYQLTAKGVYAPVAPDANGIYSSVILSGFWLREAWLWQEPLPEIEDTVLEIAGDAYARHLLRRLRQRGFLAES